MRFISDEAVKDDSKPNVLQKSALPGSLSITLNLPGRVLILSARYTKGNPTRELDQILSGILDVHA